MRKTLILIVCTLFLGFATRSMAQERKASKFWDNIEVGTNLIPMIDSLTLKFDNLQVKYFYGKRHDNAFRVNLILSEVQVHTPGNGVANTDVTYKLELGHVWYYNLREHVKLFQAADIEYNNRSTSSFGVHSQDYIFNRNVISTCYSLGICYEFYKKFSIDLETRVKAGLTAYYQNYQIKDGVEVFSPSHSLFWAFKYKPINSLTLNYRF